MAIIAVSNSACVSTRLGEAAVKDQNGVPCFTVTEKEQQRAGVPLLVALDLADVTVTTKPVVEIWSFVLPASERAQPMPASACILYGQALPGSDVTKAPEPLQTGRLYEVYLNARPVDTSDPTFGVHAKFCLIAQAGGGVKVHQVIYKDGWRTEECRLTQ